MTFPIDPPTPAEIRAETVDYWWHGPISHWRIVGQYDGRSNHPRITIPIEDAQYQSDYDAGYDDGVYWRTRMNDSM